MAESAKDCRIHRLHFCRELGLPKECPGHDPKQSDGETPLVYNLLGMQSTPLLLSLPGSLWPEVVAPDRVLSVGRIELNSVNTLSWIVLNELFSYSTVSNTKQRLKFCLK